MKPQLAVVLAILALTHAACSTYDTRYRYRPKPFAALVVARGEEHNESPVARALISVTGVRKRTEGLPTRVEVAILLENLSDLPLTFDAASSQLVTGDLQRLGAPAIEGPADWILPPGGDLSLHLFFPIPEGLGLDDLDLDGLNLTWILRAGDRPITQTSTFHRVYRPAYGMYDYYPPPYWGAPYPFWSFGGWWTYGY